MLQQLQQQIQQLQDQQQLTQQRHQAEIDLAVDNLRIAEQDRDRLAALQNARALRPDARPDAGINNLIDRLQNASLTTPAPPRPTGVPEKQRVFTTDQERTAYILQQEASPTNKKSSTHFEERKKKHL